MHSFRRDHLVLPLPEGHRFPMEKYRLLLGRLGRSEDLTVGVPEAATAEQRRRVHSASGHAMDETIAPCRAALRDGTADERALRARSHA